MAVKIFQDYHALSREAAHEILSQVRNKPSSVLCLAAGDTPRFCYNLLSEIARNEGVDFSQCTFVALDEWIGIPPENEGSCAYFLNTNLFGPLGSGQHQINLFNAMATDLQRECKRMDEVINQRGGIDLMMVGIGMNGHIGFNEPGVSEHQYTHVVDLDETTRSVGQKYFRETTHLTRGITLGFRHLLESQKVILMASGKKKAYIIRKALQEHITTEVPASIIRKHKHSLTMLDKDAAAALTII
jgi:glucosamine-6-phosphate isomerase